MPTFVCVLWRQRWCEIMNYGYVNSDFIGMKLGLYPNETRTQDFVDNRSHITEKTLSREIFLQKE